MKQTLLVLVAVLTLSTVPAWAQSYPNMTTLSASVTSSATTVRLTSATGAAANGALFVDGELMSIVSVSGTTITVNRLQRPAAHGSGASVFVVPVANKGSILPHDGARRAGQCSTSTSSAAATALSPTLTGLTYLPIIDVDTGDVYMCRRATGGLWLWTVTNAQGFNSLNGSVPTAWP